MKNSIKNLFAAALVMVTLSSATLSVNATETKSNYTAITSVKNISKIIVTGNVKLIIVQDAKESVEIINKYTAKNTSVEQKGTLLTISSSNKNMVTVIAHVNNLTTIEASNTSTVSTYGKLNLLNLSVTLNDEASANINTNTVNLFTCVKDSASLKLEGSTENHSAFVSVEAKIKMADFVAQDTNISVIIKPALAKN
ncbi:GIN domain-containing protein [Pedobacter mucosus]|uniref:GIN domain-containing protein n=1 Tax=Pedobacter mucosus TaxID=2895286 RepID=UPI001EE3EE5C|nr:DUF2807 domain-containing protein [Pedobacter mucosus]UKT63686.1 DUF2807 domain-containing protein [Pedobacter mucosus]